MMFYEHAKAYQAGEQVIYEEEPPPLDMDGVEINDQGHKVYNR